MELRIKCESCKEESYPTVYLSNERIDSRSIPSSDYREYIALVYGKSVCPRCGHINNTVFKNEIYPSDIIDLAVKRYKREQ